MAYIIDGKARAAALRASVSDEAARLKADTGIVPGLATVIVGEDPASQVYVRNKGKQAKDAGFESFSHVLPEETSEAALLALVDELNGDPAVHGILVQLPLPDHIDEQRVINRIASEKDVDGFSVENVGKLGIGAHGFVPCTPVGCLMMIKDCVFRLFAFSTTSNKSNSYGLHN